MSSVFKISGSEIDQSSRSVVSDSLQPHDPQHTRPPCPSLTPGVHPNSCPLCRWCHPAISSSVVPFSSCPQSLPASGSFPMSQLFASGGQSIGVSASASVLPVNTRDWSPLGSVSRQVGWMQKGSVVSEEVRVEDEEVKVICLCFCFDFFFIHVLALPQSLCPRSVALLAALSLKMTSSLMFHFSCFHAVEYHLWADFWTYTSSSPFWATDIYIQLPALHHYLKSTEMSNLTCPIPSSLFG